MIASFGPHNDASYVGMHTFKSAQRSLAILAKRGSLASRVLKILHRLPCRDQQALVLGLLNHLWFQRISVIQEIAVARKQTIIC